MPGYGFGSTAHEMNKYVEGQVVGGYGDKLRDDVKRFYGATLGMAGRGEAVAGAFSLYEGPVRLDWL